MKSGESGTKDRRAVENTLDGPAFQLAGVVDERPGFAAKIAAFTGLRLRSCPAPGLAEERVRLLVELARLPGVRVTLGQDIEGVFAKWLGDAGRMSEPHRLLTHGQQLLEQVVHGQIARGAREDAFPPTDGLANQLDDCRCFPRPPRAVDDGQALRRQRQGDGLSLRVVEATPRRT